MQERLSLFKVWLQKEGQSLWTWVSAKMYLYLTQVNHSEPQMQSVTMKRKRAISSGSEESENIQTEVITDNFEYSIIDISLY